MSPDAHTLSLIEAAALIGCHPETLRDMAARREAPGSKIGNKPWRFSKAVLVAWWDQRCLDNLRQQPKAKQPGMLLLPVVAFPFIPDLHQARFHEHRLQ